MPCLDPFRFLHTGDLHLDSPVEGLTSAAPPEILALLRGPRPTPGVASVDTAIEHRVDFVVMALDPGRERTVALA